MVFTGQHDQRRQRRCAPTDPRPHALTRLGYLSSFALPREDICWTKESGKEKGAYVGAFNE